MTQSHPHISHIMELVQQEQEEFIHVLDDIKKRETLSENVNDTVEETRTFGERLADRIADFGGSWKFIIIFMSFLAGWMILNSLILVSRAFDPYPYILLNLMLSSLAALQAPVIMMSQKRQEIRDRLQAENDYKVNLKAELEIRSLHDKLDHLLNKKRSNLIEIQELQLKVMQKDTTK